MAASDQTMPVKAWSTQLEERRRLTANTFELRLSRPTGFDFNPGQHIALQAEGTEREYSLVTSPTENALAVLVRRIPGGRLTPFLDQVPVGTPLSFNGPDGRFVFHPGQRPAVMVATGTGIAPFMAMLRAGARPFMLLHGVRRVDELYYRDEIQAAVKNYVPCLSTDDEMPTGAFHGYVTRYLQTRLAPITCDFYLAGRMAMIQDAMPMIDSCFPSARVYTEAFF